MFETGQLVVYGTAGVCRVEGTGQLEPKSPRIYYHLRPLYQDGLIYAPVDSDKVSIRPVISRAEAEALVDLIPTVQAHACRERTMQLLTQRYQAQLQSGDYRDLLELIMSIYAKKQEAEQQRRRLGMVDERYMRQAERLLHGELAAALGIPFESVPAYIAGRVEQIKDAQAEA